MYFLYSSKVVAPITCSSPRESAGLSMLPASIAPSVLPAPTTVWISSINRMIRPSSATTSFSSAFRRSSNSPRYFAPATSPAISRLKTRLLRSVSGTSPFTIRCAKPSTTAVLPTPGSPIRTGLFLLLRCRICIARRISSSRPITGSSLPSLAFSVRSTVYFFRASRLFSASGLSTFSPPRTDKIAFSRLSLLRPSSCARCAASHLLSHKAKRKRSVEMNLSPSLSASLSIELRIAINSRLIWTLSVAPETSGSLPIASFTLRSSSLTLTPERSKSVLPVPSVSFNTASSK